MFVSFYSIVKKRGLKVAKSDPTRVRYKCDVGCLFVCLISEVGKGQGFEAKTLEMKHTCQPCFKNRRASQQALAHYFKNKIQNNRTYKVTDMRKHVDDKFSLNVSYTKMKRVKRIILEKLDGSFIDDFNKLEAYAQELRDTNPESDVVINISKDALEQGNEREPPMVPTHLHHTVLNHYCESRDQSAELPSPQHVVLNHLYLDNRQVPGSVIAVGATHRFRSKYVTVVLYKPVQRRGGSTNNA
ncbi:SNF1-related protein kinase regulatory subunit beta-3 [Capsicum baccatum]|uniref:SNF1-related protein kinase regulatory subunit beta-3 n=1 Tax=Capsicum baccatum TaxID=33114 RepID=A0A2G2WMW8_CAPBA|nr:SNF1-related protein kinase regulatory subunit beta-3 [Capsicum baccatum]